MENKKGTITIVLVVLAFIGAYLYVNKKAVAPVVGEDTNTVTTPVGTQGKQFCYFLETKGTESTDDAFTSINYDVGDKVHGIINWIPGEKDSLVGIYTGTVEKNDNVATMGSFPNRLNILYTASGEGIINHQQEIIIVGAHGIQTGTGEKYQDTDGTYKFKDLKTLTFGNPLPLADCASVPDRFKKDYINKD